jgi:hypothetical protein
MRRPRPPMATVGGHQPDHHLHHRHPLVTAHHQLHRVAGGLLHLPASLLHRVGRPAPVPEGHRMRPAWGGSGDPNGVPRSIGRSWTRLGGLLLAITVTASLALVPLAASVAALSAAAARQVAGMPPLARLLARPPADSVVYAADGSVLAVLHGDQDRTVVPLAAIPVRVRQAVLAVEASASTSTARSTRAASPARWPPTCAAAGPWRAAAPSPSSTSRTRSPAIRSACTASSSRRSTPPSSSGGWPRTRSWPPT